MADGKIADLVRRQRWTVPFPERGLYTFALAKLARFAKSKQKKGKQIESGLMER